MRVSDLIRYLERKIEGHGDLQIRVYGQMNGDFAPASAIEKWSDKDTDESFFIFTEEDALEFGFEDSAD
jgi:hypothetical protein